MIDDNSHERDESHTTDEWTCPTCGAGDPHNELTFPEPDDPGFEKLGMTPEPEIAVDVTCESVYVLPVDGGDGFAFTHREFRKVIDLFNEVNG